ncbi:MAG: glutamate synthase-related protein, partial [bacterium]|nr:glutamate synthase-related protein [bacterium]
IGGRSNSGEGGENPYYLTDGIHASVKQVASARFGVTAQYLVTGNEVQIKIAQGAKPGEGGQLMGVKVNPDIATARHSNPGVDLISPPPLHDIYSIEDLKQLIYELKQLKPGMKVNVKLVSGANIGTVAVGVAKAGADVIHVSGGEGGTGAASLSSMKHCGLPWELGLIEVHKVLLENGLRESVTLRVDGGLSSGEDLLKAILLGAQEFEFGKLLLIAEGCVMARICEKNTCPVGIATHDPKFKAKYKGNSTKIIRLMKLLAEDLQSQLSNAGLTNISDAVGRTDLLEPNPKYAEKIVQRGLDLEALFGSELTTSNYKPLFDEELSVWNQKSLSAVIDAVDNNRDEIYETVIRSTDRAALSTVAGELAARKHLSHLKKVNGDAFNFYDSVLQFNLKGSAGQGFAVFQNEGMNIRLEGEANDSVCKGISGGFTVITPPAESRLNAGNNTIVGNCALYGATGGKVYVHGVAGDRFAVRNSGATTVVEGVGLHACEYMTNGTVVILGSALQNVGAGMTGGIIYSFESLHKVINQNYLIQDKLLPENMEFLHLLLKDYQQHTGSLKAQKILNNWGQAINTLEVYIPKFEYLQREILDDSKVERSDQAV